MAERRLVDFFFDFSSAYSFLALSRLNALEGAEVRWRAMSLGVVFKTLGSAPAPADSPKGRYLAGDVERSARRDGVPFVWPSPFPFNSIPAARAFYVIERAQGAPTAVAFAKAAFSASFQRGLDLSDMDVLSAVAGGVVAGGAFDAEMTQDAAVKAQLKDVTEEALALGVFGAPTFAVDGELFWGCDRIDDARRAAVGGHSSRARGQETT